MSRIFLAVGYERVPGIWYLVPENSDSYFKGIQKSRHNPSVLHLTGKID